MVRPFLLLSLPTIRSVASYRSEPLSRRSFFICNWWYNIIMNKTYEKALLSNQNKWIAVSSDRSKILTSGKSIQEVEGKLGKLDVKDVVITFVPPANRYLSP